MNQHSSLFFEAIKKNYQENTLIRVLLSKISIKDDDLLKVTIRPVRIKKERKLSFLYHYKTRDTTKNHTLQEAINEMQEMIGTRFKNSIAFTQEKDIHLSYNKKLESSLQFLKPSSPKPVSQNHDREKPRLIETDNNIYLQEL